MPKYIFTIAFFLIIPFITCAQQPFKEAVKQYYRVNPFAGSFSSFVEALTQDPDLINSQILKKNDSTGFYVKGEYKVFNPFGMNADKVDLLFYETAYYGKNTFVFDYYAYQLTAYFPDTKVDRAMILKDYDAMQKKFSRFFKFTKQQDLKDLNQVNEGAIATFDDRNDFKVPPFVVSWQTLKRTNQLVLTIELKLVNVNNLASPVAVLFSGV